MSGSIDNLKVGPCGTHHLRSDGREAYQRRFDQVLPFHAPGLAPVKRIHTAWHIRPDGTDAYKARFDETFGFYCGVAAVVSDGLWFHIDSEGNPLYESRYAFVGNFQNDACVVCDLEGSYYHIDLSGKPLYSSKWSYCGDFREGAAVVQGRDGLSSHIDFSGKLIHDQWFIDLDVFHKGYARARSSEGWHHISRAGTPLYPARYANLEPFYNGRSRVETDDGGLRIINEQGVTLRILRRPTIDHFAELSADMVGYWRTMALKTASQSELFDQLPANQQQLSKSTGMVRERLVRFLRALGELGVIQVERDKYVLTEKGQYLRSDHPKTLVSAAGEYGGDLLRRWERLPAILKGAEVDQGIFDEVSNDEERVKAHHEMLASYALHDYAPVVPLLNINAGDVVFDAAGGTGTLSSLVKRRFPETDIYCGDKAEISQQQLYDGVNYLPFDLFEPWPICADKLLLARVLHDWNDEQVALILQHAKAALRPGGELLILEMFLPTLGFGGGVCDLHLLAVTGGQERSEDHYSDLLHNAGFDVVETIHGASLVSVLRCRPKP
ncbi:methyltransferase [Marinobacter salsuginis]|uniref:methyltransferase n=1 Tax=Marinobacter salsuginis TaxID=418719 RepID=UPI00273EA647|nr:methyltransferase [Marinobacter salsuginis]